jgi:hypothetical protein
MQSMRTKPLEADGPYDEGRSDRSIQHRGNTPTAPENAHAGCAYDAVDAWRRTGKQRAPTRHRNAAKRARIVFPRAA